MLISLDALRGDRARRPGLAGALDDARAAPRPERASPVADAGADAVVDAIKAAFPQAGWEVRTRRNVSPEFSRNLERFTQFLTLVGLTALVVGGVGVANAVRATVERKRPSLAILKALGAPAASVFADQPGAGPGRGGLGIAAGLVVGAALPFVVAGAVRHRDPVSAGALDLSRASSRRARSTAC